jgi:hypothetical protein
MTDRGAAGEIHPVQNQRSPNRLSSKVTLRAYEVYCHVHGEQPAMVDLAGRGCRGGFGTGELLAFLYARSFPKEEWSQRVDEAFRGMETVR